MAEVGPPIDLPIINISNPNDPVVGKAMIDAAAKYGFLYVDSRGTDFTYEDVEKAFGLVCWRCAATSYAFLFYIYRKTYLSNKLPNSPGSFSLLLSRKSLITALPRMLVLS